MFYNYLIFSIVALSLHIFQKYLVSQEKTKVFLIRNFKKLQYIDL